MSIDLSRQAAMIPAHNVKKLNALLIGVGSIGSNAAHVLASMGVERMTLVDGDIVQRENIGPAFFLPEDALLELQKVDTLSERLEELVNKDIHMVRTNFTHDTELPDAPYNLVVVGTDNLESRRDAWNRRGDFIDEERGAIWVDGRMGGPQLSMYGVWTKSRADCDNYEQILFNGTPPPPLPCGLKATAALTKGYVPGFIGQIVYNIVNDMLPPYMQMKDLGDGTHVLLDSECEDEFRFELVGLA